MSYNLHRYITAQEAVYEQVKQELLAGYKHSHWMWYIFPQIKGLGRSSTSVYYAIESLDEAKNYLEHPVLGSRLEECCQILLELEDKSAESIFGGIDAKKLKSSMTLFALVSEKEIFREVLQKYFGGKEDVRTKKIVSK
ncbi:uncharacterized protein (DUF1810 family) [Parabacteroides sp. PFB2-12]|uniref:DUF1810 domain-containing protein n=1 Tax=unclassified Parabacteroides TaxID=2649774 RepID=UPI0024741241|nr:MULTISPECIES: DUF1810 domain-containing protein [unclassified Parabacteroides]MDH6341896.1 uncharacterized protein (DUF1810 family) [Parabacteroides sp. PM6-13]MDH6389594.1 uncharacterized protein (DUF1810 family) [Parabacteroides sp. PFB2-12]